MTKVKCEWFGCEHNLKSYCQKEEIRLKFVTIEIKTTRIMQGMDESDLDKKENVDMEDWLKCNDFEERQR